MVSSSVDFLDGYSCLARWQLSPRTVFTLGRVGFTTHRTRPGITDRSHGQSSAAHDGRSCFDLGGYAGNFVVSRFAKRFVQAILVPLFRSAPLQKVGRVLSQPALCWFAAAAALVGWHVPSLFALGLQSHLWHAVQHFSFLGCGFLFWWPVVQPWPSVPTWPRWSILLYLFLATLPCDILSAFLAFSDRIVYPVYLSTGRQFSISALEDQQCAAALMWTCVTIIYLVPATILTIQLLAAWSIPGNAPDRQNLAVTFGKRVLHLNKTGGLENRQVGNG
jgi:hypothetical protein